MKESMKSWWKSLNQREQLFVGGGSITAIVVLFYLFIWSPFTTHLANTEHYVAYQQNLVSWMKQASQKLQILGGSATKVQKISNSELLSTLDTTIKKQQLASFMNGMQQSDNNTVLVKFKKVPFDYLIAWIDSLWKQYEIKVQRINITPNIQKNGLVAANVYFTL